MASSSTDRFHLGHDLVEQIFGLEGHGIYDLAADEARLLEAIGTSAQSRYSPLTSQSYASVEGASAAENAMSIPLDCARSSAR